LGYELLVAFYVLGQIGVQELVALGTEELKQLRGF
jgi:hypothetical protein